MTKDLIKRYKSHIKPSIATDVTLYIKSLINDHGRYPEMHVIDYLPYEAAMRKEKELIACFAKGGHKLINNSHYIFQKRFTPIIPALLKYEDQIKALQHRLDVFMYNYNVWNNTNNHYVVFPKNPF